MKTTGFLPLAVALLGGVLLGAAEPSKPKIAISDFTTIDIQGQKFYRFTDRTDHQSPQDSLSEADRQTIDDRMLGLVKMIDATSEADRRRHDQARLDLENERNLARQTELADRILKSGERSVVIGAQYLAAALGKYNSVEVVDQSEIDRAFAQMAKLQAGQKLETEDFGKATGATHLLYGTVADLRTAEKRFTGYGVKTSNVVFSLDVIFKLVELSSQKVIWSQVCTGVDTVLNTENLETIDSDRFKVLLNDASVQAAAAIDKLFTPRLAADSSGATAIVTDAPAATPMPKITLSPRLPAGVAAEVRIDGVFKGHAPLECELRPGRHVIELSADGYGTKKLTADITGGENFTPQLQPIMPQKVAAEVSK
ncbi:MAG: PEGA domain-containing protein [Victivallaceae bacterium]|nr:PEGA domain-containing protein [Victivallaceae bacterium]